MTIDPIGLFNGNYHLNGVTLNNSGQLRTQVAPADDYFISAFDTNTLSYTDFITLTAGNPATCDLSTSVTIGGQPITAGGITTIDATTGSATPTAGAVTFVGASGITTSATGSTVTITGGGGGVTSSLSPYIVGATNSDYTDIQSAITAAVAAGATNTNPVNIYVKPGTYSGNFTLEPGINIIGFTENGGIPGFSGSLETFVVPAVIITGNITIAASSQCILQGIYLNPSSGASIADSGNSWKLTISNCKLAGTPNFSIGHSAGQASLFNCYLTGMTYQPAASSVTFILNMTSCVVNESSSSNSNSFNSTFTFTANYCYLATFKYDATSSTNSPTTFTFYFSFIGTGSSNIYQSAAAGSSNLNFFNCRVTPITTIASFNSASCSFQSAGSTFTTIGTIGTALGANPNYVAYDTIDSSYFYTGTTKGIALGSNLTSPTITFGAGVPSASAAQGSLYLNTTGSSTSTRAYINTDGSTGWTSITTAT